MAATDSSAPTAARAPSVVRGSTAPRPRETGFRWLYVIDASGLIALMLAVTIARFGFSWPSYGRTEYFAGFGIALVVHQLVGYFGGLYDRENRLGRISRLPRVAGVTSVAILIDAALSLGADKFVMPRLNLIVFAFAATAFLTFTRWMAQRLRTTRFGRPRVLLVGAPDDIARAESHLRDSDRDARIVGRTSETHRLGQMVDSANASDVLLLTGDPISQIYPDPLNELEQRRVGLYQRLRPSDTLLGIRRTRQIAGMPFIPLRRHALPTSKAHFKRVLDLTYMLVAVPVIVPVMVFAVLYTRIVAGGPVFYRQDRVGRSGRPFSMVKLRTMYVGSEDVTGPTLASRDDDRVIPGMAWTRATRLDELPQLWNVLRGDMSLVGPRPERPELAADFEALLPGYSRRHDIRPGITGLAQVQGSYHTDPGYKLGHDLQYLVNWSPILDLQILVRTIGTVTRREV